MTQSEIQKTPGPALLEKIRKKELTWEEVDKALEKAQKYGVLDWLGDQLAKDDVKASLGTDRLLLALAAKILELSKNPTYRKRIQEVERKQHNQRVLDESEKHDKNKKVKPSQTKLVTIGILPALPKSGLQRIEFKLAKLEDFGSGSWAQSIVLQKPDDTDIYDAIETAEKDGFKYIIICDDGSEAEWKSVIKDVIDDIQSYQESHG